MILIFIRKLVVSLVVIPIGLIVNLVFRFWGHTETYENSFFRTKEDDDDDNNTNINKQPNNEGQKVKGEFRIVELK